MLSRRHRLLSKQVSTDNDTYPVKTKIAADFPARRYTSGASIATKLDMEVCSFALPLISKHDARNPNKVPDKGKIDLPLLRRTTSHFVKPSKYGHQRHKLSRYLSHKTPNYSCHVYDLYMNSPFVNLGRHRKQQTWTQGCRVTSLDCTGETALSNIPAFSPEDRLKTWIQQSYKIRQHHGGAEDNSFNEVLVSSRESSLIPQRSNNDSPRSVEHSSRSNSFIKQGKRTPSPWIPAGEVEILEQETSRKKRVRTFRRYVLVVKSLVGLLMSMKRLSISKTRQSAYSEFLYILAGPTSHAAHQGQGSDSQSLLFDKSWFSRSRAWSRMPGWAQAVMRLPPEERTEEDVHHLKQLLGTMRGFRENMTDEMRTKLCEVVTYTRCDTGRIIFRQGHIGHHFYFIFSGSVLIQSDSLNEKTGETEILVENVLRAGEGFGEIALLGDGRRTASVICKEPTELCQIDKDTFLQTCPALFHDQLQERIDFVRRFDIFQSWDSDDLTRLCFLSQVLDVPHSRVIDRNWSTSKFAYFVMKGRVSMMKEFDAADSEKAGQRNDKKGKRKQKVMQFAIVGTLHAGDCSDLSVLAMEPRKGMCHITLVSQGTRLFRVAVRTFLRLCPKAAMEEYLKVYVPCKIATEEEIRAHYLHTLSWSEFKKNMVHTKRLEKAGSVMASIPATLKGSSGWARWPGYTVIRKSDKMNRDIEDVATANHPTSDTSIQEATENTTMKASFK